MKNTGHAELLPIGGLGFMFTTPKTAAKQSGQRERPQEDLTPAEQAERLANCKQKAKANKTARERLFASLEKEDSPMKEGTERRLFSNRASLQHISTFWNIGIYAKSNQLKVGYGVFYRVMKKDAVKTVWKHVRGWLKKNENPEVVLAVSIGYRKRGVVVIRYIATGADNESIWAASRALEGYLYKVKGFKPELSAALVEDISALALERYAVDIETKEELLGLYGSEMLESLKAGLLVYKSSRTYRNGEALKLLEERTLEVANKAAFPVNGLSCYGASPSRCGLVDGLAVNKKGVVTDAWSTLMDEQDIDSSMEDDEEESEYGF